MEKTLPAFPQPNQLHPQNPDPESGCGMTLRDYFASRAMSAQISAVGGLERGDNDQALELAVCAYEMADAMMQARDV